MQIKRIFDVNFEGFKMISIDFYILLIYDHPKGKNALMGNEKILFFKNTFIKCMIFVANFQQMLQKILSTIVWYQNSFEIFF